MRLFATALLLSLRHSARRLLCLLLMTAVLFAALSAAAAMPAAGRETLSSARIAVVLRESDPAIQTMMPLLLRSQQNELLSFELVTDGEETEGYSAVLTVPDGFLNGLMTGENLSPTLSVDLSSPLEAMWARQLAQSVSRSLTAAQRSLAGAALALEGVPHSGGLLWDCNLTLVDSFMDRASWLGSETHSATGALPPAQYYGAAAAVLLGFCYAFLWQPTVRMLRGFWGRSGRHAAVTAAAFAACVLLSAAFLLPCTLLLGDGLPRAVPFAALSLLLGAFAMLMSCAVSQQSACAVCCFGISAAMVLPGGGLLPHSLLPPALQAAGELTPFYSGMQLFSDAVFGISSKGALLYGGLTAAALLSLALLLWRRQGRDG